MNILKVMACLAALCWQITASAQRTLISSNADGGGVHSSSSESVVSSSGGSYSTSGTAPTKARPEEAYAYQLGKVNRIAMAINARRMQKINSQIQSIQFNNPFTAGEPQTGFTDWNKDRSKLANDADNEDYATLSTSTSSTSRYRSTSGYIDHNSMTSKMTPSNSSEITEQQLEADSRQDIQKEYLTKVADKTIDKTIDDIEDEDVKARMKSIKEIHTETSDLFEQMIDNFFKPYSQEEQERIDRFFGDYTDNVLTSFAKANSTVREKMEEAEEYKERAEKYIRVGELVFDKYNPLKL